jgi:hypothetical protein
VTVAKQFVQPQNEAVQTLVTVISRGYNVGWDSTTGDCSGTSPNKLERAIEQTYYE